MAALPSGTVTFLFTDIEGSSRLWEAQDVAMRAAVSRHDALMRHAIEGAGGHVFKTMGDAFCAAFATAPEAIAAALAAQQAMGAERWPAAACLRVRMAVQTGAAELRGADYFGAPLNRIARLLAAGHGGQTLVSETTHDLCRDHLAPRVTMKLLGEHNLKDLARRERVFQLCHPDLPSSFPPLKTLLRPVDAEMPSIAVLPFVNLSRDNENEYFADGLAEELLNVLAKIRGLRVASRTSAFFFKGKDVDLATVAQKLNVAAVLEGSVRTAGNRVRITAQLIEVATDSHLWSDTYDRELTDIFAVQDDISQSVVVELRRALLGDRADAKAQAQATAEVAVAAQGRGANAQAFRMYLEARTAIERNTRADNERGIGLFRQALAMQPDFALAWAGLAWAYAQTAASAWVPFADGYGRAREAADQALALAPDLAEGHQAMAAVLIRHDFDWKRAATEIQRALEIAPDNVESLRGASNLAAIEGRTDDAIAFAREIVTRDPLSLAAHRHLAWTCLDAGHLDEAEAAINVAFELGPGSGHIYAASGCLRLQQGRFDEALAAFSAESLPIYRGRGIAIAQYALGHRAESDAALAELVALRAHTGAFQIAEVHAYRGEADEAFAWLERALSQRDPGVTDVKTTFFLRNLHRDSRWQPFLAKMGLSD
jgi:TolB-like protein/class 3 adenylate cyclase